jgi:outer membrane receptor protein involved in Fe transport
MNKILAMLTALSMTALGVSAQVELDGTVKGNLQASQKSVEAASVGLLRAKDSAVVKRAVTDRNGDFTMEKLGSGKYLVVVQAAGFAKYYSGAFELNSANKTQHLKITGLKPVARDLATVSVTSKRPLIEQKLDKTIINVDASPSNAGTTAMDVLEKSPGISVDKDGNISLKGKQGVMILMDGRPTYLSGQDLANMLRNMSSSNLEQIEIMTNPPAKFDASGNAGVINIKTKKSRIQGFNGSFNTGYSQSVFPKANNSINLNYRTGKFNFFGNAGHYYSHGFGDLTLRRNFRDKSSNNLLSIFDQVALADREFRNYNFKTGFDYFASKNTSLGVVLTGFGNNGIELIHNNTLIKDNTGTLTTRTQSENEAKNDFKNIGVNANFRHVFDTTGTELTVDVDYINYTSANSQLLNSLFFDNTGNRKNPDEIIRGRVPSTIDIYSAKTDFSKTLKGGIRFEAGLKSSYVTTDNNAQYANMRNGQYITDPNRSNHFLYKENINAAYVNFGKQFGKKWSGQLGLRAENTIMKGDQLTTGQTFKRDYTQVFPTFYIGYTLNEKNQFSLNYGRRINRPNYQDLNPFFYFLDKYTYQVGNPYLNPQFSHNIELNHIYKGVLTTSVHYSYTTDIIQDVLEQIDSTTTTYVKKSNIARRWNLGASMSLGVPLTKWWRTNVYLLGFYNQFDGVVNGGTISIGGTNFMANMNNQFSFQKGWGVEVSGFYRANSLEGVLVIQPMGAMNIGVSKQVLKNKGTVKLGLSDVFYTQQFNGYSRYQNVDVTIHHVRDSRAFSMNFSYRFGKGKPVQQQRRRGSATDEQSRVQSGSNG